MIPLCPPNCCATLLIWGEGIRRLRIREGLVKAYRTRATQVALLAASSLYGLISAVPAMADTAAPPTSAVDSPGIIINNTLNSTTPPPTGSVDTTHILMPDGSFSNGVTIGAATGVNGVGQMTIATSPTSTALLLCTGTLINPRTVIFAGHSRKSPSMRTFSPAIGST